jgi:uncharacterized protein (TIGR03083 family)
MTLLEREASLDAIDREGAALVAAAAAAPGAQVPSCPDWDSQELVRHVARVHFFWNEIMRRGLRSESEVSALEPQDGDDAPAPDPAEARAALIETFRATPDDTPCWTWARDQSVGFVRRFQVLEATMHRVDAEQAAGRPSTIDVPVALHGLDVSFETLWLPASKLPLPGSVHVHCTDADGEWIVHPDGRVETGHQKGDAALRGRAQDLLMVLWHRLPLDAIEVPGARDVASALVTADSRQ